MLYSSYYLTSPTLQGKDNLLNILGNKKVFPKAKKLEDVHYCLQLVSSCPQFPSFSIAIIIRISIYLLVYICTLLKKRIN